MIKLKVLMLSYPYYTDIAINTNVEKKNSYKNLHLIMKEVQSRGWIICLYHVIPILLYHVTQ